MFSQFLLPLALLSVLFTLASCGGSGGGSSNSGDTGVTADLNGIAEDGCSDVEEVEGFTGIWIMQLLTKAALTYGISQNDIDLSFLGEDPLQFVDIGLIVADNDETLNLSICETAGTAEMIREDDGLVLPSNFSDLTNGEDIIQEIIIVNDDTISVVADALSFKLDFKRTEIEDNDVCMVFGGMEKLARTKVACIDMPLFPEGNTKVDSQLTMAVVTGGVVYQIWMQLDGSIEVGTYDVASENVDVTVESSTITALYGVEMMQFVSGTITIIAEDEDHIEGSLNLVSSDGVIVQMEFNTVVY
ncbi:MAG: hypothetical protein JKY24_04470 [Pseudomonadales bacterium]|nr:hypothetical protein [Pseudomonadales bacterium]